MASDFRNLQALVEEAAEAGRGKIWVMVTTHEDMGSIYQNAKRLEAHGDFKKIEGRFRAKWNLTTENIELVLEDCVFRKNVQGKQEAGSRCTDLVQALFGISGNYKTRRRFCRSAPKNGSSLFIPSCRIRFI